MFDITAFLLNLAATGFMAGLIWFVQVVHYPLFEDVHTEAFCSYHALHTRRTTAVVAGPMIVEVLTAGWMIISPPAFLGRSLAIVGLVLLGFIWISTAWLQVPQHNLLRNGFADVSYQKLCWTNWIRTIAWSARLVILLCALAMALR